MRKKKASPQNNDNNNNKLKSENKWSVVNNLADLGKPNLTLSMKKTKKEPEFYYRILQ